MLTADVDHYRRIFPDRCDWPKGIEPTNRGYSIGRRIAEDGDGRYDRREVATRGFKGPRCCAASGLPLHFDDQSVFKEPIHLDRTDPHLIDDEIADPPLTRPPDRQEIRSRARSGAAMAAVRLRRRQFAGHRRPA